MKTFKNILNTWHKITISALVCLFLVNTCCYGLSPTPASCHPPTIRKVLDHAIRKRFIRYAKSVEAKQLLRENDTPCLLLSSGLYLVTENLLNKGSLRLLRAINHEDVEALMQILAKEAPRKYERIRKIVMTEYPPHADNKLPVNLYINHTIASAFEWLLLVEQKILLESEIPAEEKVFFNKMRNTILDNSWCFSGEIDFWNIDNRAEKILEARNKGMRFYVVAGRQFNENESSFDQNPGNEKDDFRNLINLLRQYLAKVENLATDDSQNKNIPINELNLYIRTLIAMGEVVISKLDNSLEYDMYALKTEFAGELAHLARFLPTSAKLFNNSTKSAFHILGEQKRGSMDNLSSIDEMATVMYQIIAECAKHPFLQETALTLINDPTTYGFDPQDIEWEEKQGPWTKITKSLLNTVKNRRKEIAEISTPPAKNNALINSTQPGTSFSETEPGSLPLIKLGEFSDISDKLIHTAKTSRQGRKEGSNKIQPDLHDVLYRRGQYFFLLADGTANNEPAIARDALKEHMRLLKNFGLKTMFFTSSMLEKSENLLSNHSFRSLLLDIARCDLRDGKDTLIVIAKQYILEGDINLALNLIKEINFVQSCNFEDLVERMIELIFNPEQYAQEKARRLESIIQKIKIPGECRDGYMSDAKVQFLVAIGDKYTSRGQTKEAAISYTKAWHVADEISHPFMARMEHLIPVMCEKGDQLFPGESKEAIMDEAKAFALSQLKLGLSYSNSRPMVSVARAYAYGRNYKEAKECVRLIKDNLDYPDDHVRDANTAVAEGAYFNGETAVAEVFANDASAVGAAKMFARKDRYQEAMKAASYANSEIFIAEKILRKDRTQINFVKPYLTQAVKKGLHQYSLQSILDLLIWYPELDSDGSFLAYINKMALERNNSVFQQKSHRIILKNLRAIMLKKAEKANNPIKHIVDLTSQINDDKNTITIYGDNPSLEQNDKSHNITFDPDMYDAEEFKVLYFDVLNKVFADNNSYTIKYDASRLSDSQTQIIKEYVKKLNEKTSCEFKAYGCASSKGSNEPLISVYRKDATGNTIGTGQLDVMIPHEDRLDQYVLRITGMINIVLAESHLSEDLSKDARVTISGFIRRQCQLMVGETVQIPERMEELIKFIKSIPLPTMYKKSINEIEEYNRLAKKALTFA